MPALHAKVTDLASVAGSTGSQQLEHFSELTQTP
jgi:hypothetical protein